MGRNERMRRARQEAGLSQEELARRIEASRQTVNMIERGDYNPSLHLCISICRTLGKTLDELFWPEEELVDRENEHGKAQEDHRGARGVRKSADWKE